MESEPGAIYMAAAASTSNVGPSRLAAPVMEEKRRPEDAMLGSRFPRIAKVAARLLEPFIRREARVTTLRPPLSHFWRQQVAQAAQDILTKINEKTITYEDIRDTVDNLTALHSLAYKKSKVIAKELGYSIHELTTILDELGTTLEKLSGLPSTDFMDIGDAVVAKTEDTHRILYWSGFLPKMEQLTSIRLLGTGAFGTVYKVKYKPTNFVCAMKLVKQDNFVWPENACMEKVVACLINSHFLVKYYACYRLRDAYLTLMEYVPGANLERVLEKVGFLPLEVCRIVMAQLILALEHMHFRGLVHRDVKVSNIIIKPGGRVKLFDFDTSKICMGHFAKRVCKGYFTRTAFEFFDGDAAGTIPFMAPEMLRRRPYGRACDWWSAGVVMYKIMTGRLPFRAETRAEMRDKVFNQPPEWPDDEGHLHSATPEAKDMVLKLLEKDPAERLGSATYAETRQHPFYAGFDWRRLATTKDLCSVPGIEQCMEQEEKMEVPSVIDPTGLRIKRVLQLEDMEHAVEYGYAQWYHNLFTYLSPSFDRMTDTYRYETGPVELNESFFSASGSDSEELDYEKTPDAVINVDISACYAAEASADQPIAAQETRCISMVRTKRLGKYWSFGITIEQYTGENSKKFFMVERVKKGSPAEASHVLVGDIITEINGQDISELPISEVRRRIQNYGDELAVTVLSSTAGRLFESRSDWDQILEASGQDTILLRATKTACRGSRKYGLNVFEAKSWNEQTAAFFRCYVIQKVADSEIVDANKHIYPGDVLLSVDGVSVRDMEQPGVKAVLSKDASEINITIAPMSPLRVKRPSLRLHESAVTDCNVRPLPTDGNTGTAPAPR